MDTWHLKCEDGTISMAYRVAGKYYPLNRDRALEFDDFVQEILIELSKLSNNSATTPALLWRIAANTAVDLLRKGARRSHDSLNALIEDHVGSTAERGELIPAPGTEKVITELLLWIALTQSIPASALAAIHKRYTGYSLTPAERQHLSRTNRDKIVTIRTEIFD